MKLPNAYAFLLAGGSGERLWPLSRKSHPKQLLKVKGRTLLDHTIARIESLFAREQMHIVTTQQHAAAIQATVIEPMGRNTAPAIYLAALELKKSLMPFVVSDCEAIVSNHNGTDPVIVVLPTDHFIDSPTALADFLVHAVDSAAQHDGIVLIGVQPTWAATGYGYIEYEQTAQAPYRVKRFHEKPAQAQAEQYLKQNFLWNSGMLCAKLSVLVREFEFHAPEVAKTVQAYIAGTGSYEQVPSISSDYAVLEKSQNLVVLPAQFPWCDVGSLETFLSLQKEPSGQTIIEIDSQNNLVAVQEGLESVVAFVGVSDLCVVQHEGVLLIAKRGQTEQVRAVVAEIKQRKQEKLLE